MCQLACTQLHGAASFHWRSAPNSCHPSLSPRSPHCADAYKLAATAGTDKDFIAAVAANPGLVAALTACQAPAAALSCLLQSEWLPGSAVLAVCALAASLLGRSSLCMGLGTFQSLQ